MSAAPPTPPTAPREGPPVRRAQRRITPSPMAIATVMIVGLAVFTELSTLVRLGSTAVVMVAAYPFLRRVFHPRQG